MEFRDKSVQLNENEFLKMKHTNRSNQAIILTEGQGRRYECGTMTAIFKADEAETKEKYSVSEWWLEPYSDGPGAHQHEENDEVFYVLEGTISFLVDDKWIDADRGTFLRIPIKTTHDFRNQTGEKAGVLNFFIPGGFERNMPSIVKWFEDND
jgi:mannose-6-phosphate isomerase-like protein (cupin superfamily)